MTLQNMSRLGTIRLFQELIDEEIVAGGSLQSLKRKVDKVVEEWSRETIRPPTQGEIDDLETYGPQFEIPWK